MSIATRKGAREALGALLTMEMTGVGNPVHSVYDYLKRDFGSLSPVVCVGSQGALGVPMTFQGLKATYNLVILTFVSREDEQNAEDELDDVAQKLFETIEANRKTADWQSLEYATTSAILPATVGGEAYWMEQTLVRMKVY